MKKILYTIGLWKPTVAKIKTIDDQYLLEKIIQKETNYYYRREAVLKIKNEMLLKKIAKEDSHIDIRKDAISKIADQSFLAEIALADEFWEIRQVALEVIGSQDLLFKVAKNDNDRRVRQAAIKKINDKLLLREIALCEEDSQNRLVCLEKIESSEIICDIILNEKDENIRKKYIPKIKNKEQIEKIAQNENNPIIAFSILNNIVDGIFFEKILSIFVNNGIGDDIDETILHRIKDEDLLFKVLKLNKGKCGSFTPINNSKVLKRLSNDKLVALAKLDNSAVWSITTQITSESVLAEVLSFISEENFDPGIIWGMCLRSIPKIGKIETLKKIVTEGKSIVVKMNALAKMEKHDLDWIINYSLSDKQHVSYCSIIRQVSDQQKLKQIAKNAVSLEIKEAAMWKIEDSDFLFEVRQANSNFKVLRINEEKGSVEYLFKELEKLGNYESYLNLNKLESLHKYEFKGHVKARVIGRILLKKGGRSLMLQAHEHIKRTVYNKERHLEVAWDNIGDWMG